jgi:thiamine pyrophosphokinase
LKRLIPACFCFALASNITNPVLGQTLIVRNSHLNYNYSFGAGANVFQDTQELTPDTLNLSDIHSLGHILAALGGRMDQTLANIALLSNLQLATFDIRLTDGVEEIFFCNDQAQIEGRSGEIVSLIPWQGEVTGVFTENLRWNLHHETLYPDKTRGISNEMTADVATVSIKSGLLLIVHQLSVVE